MAEGGDHPQGCLSGPKKYSLSKTLGFGPRAVLPSMTAAGTTFEQHCSPEQLAPRGCSVAVGPPFNILARIRSIMHLMTVGEVAEVLGKSEKTIYRMAAKHQIPNILIGGSRHFDPSTLILWLIKKEPQLAVAARQFGLVF
jgi:excisionase family DNA binding protein